MTWRLERIERHPIKSHGRETLGAVTLVAGQALPWDRRWAVAHDAARLPDAGGWAPCVNFSRGSKTPALMAIGARLDEAAATVTLTHPSLPDLTIAPGDPSDQARLLDWLRPISPPDRAQPAGIVALPGRGLTDTDYPSVSILNLASHADLAARMGADLSPLRWRCNFWLSGPDAWAEESWPGTRLRLGPALVEVIEPIVRCKATAANPVTGEIDADTLGALNTARGEQWMGVYARVIRGGPVHEGDPVEPA